MDFIEVIKEKLKNTDSVKVSKLEHVQNGQVELLSGSISNLDELNSSIKLELDEKESSILPLEEIRYIIFE